MLATRAVACLTPSRALMARESCYDGLRGWSPPRPPIRLMTPTAEARKQWECACPGFYLCHAPRLPQCQGARRWLSRAWGAGREDACQPLVLPHIRSAAGCRQSEPDAVVVEPRRGHLRAGTTQFCRWHAQLCRRGRDPHSARTPGLDAHGRQGILVGRQSGQRAEKHAVGSTS